MSKGAIAKQNPSKSLIRSLLVSDLSESLMVAHFWVSDLSDSLTSLIFGEQPELFATITN